MTNPAVDPAVARLRPFNLVAAGLHLAQGVAMIVLSTAIALPVTAVFGTGPPGQPESPPAIDELFSYRLGPAVALFLLLSAQLWMDFGEPLFDPEPDDVPVAFGVDPRLVLWRDGAWHMPPESPVPPAPPKAGPQPQPQPQLNDPPEIGPEPVVPEVGGG